MKQLTLSEVRGLFNTQTGPCISLYLPAGAPGETQQRISVLTLEAENLLKKDYNSFLVRALLEPISNCCPSHQAKGTLCIFRSLQVSGYYVLPQETQSLAVVANSFHLKPILDEIQYVTDHYILSLTTQKAELYHHLGPEIKSVWIHDNREDSYSEPKISVLPSGQSGKHFKSSVDGMSDLLGYMIEVSEKVSTSVPAGVPLVLHATKKDATLYRMVDRNPSLLDQRLSRNGFYGSLVDVREHSHQLRTKLKQDFIASALGNLTTKMGRLRLGIKDAISAINKGEAKAVYVSRNKIQWGTIDWKKDTAILHARQQNAFDDDVLDDIAERGLQQNLPVYVVDSCQIPDGADVAVILNTRWVPTLLAPFPTKMERAFWQRFSVQGLPLAS